MPQNVEIMWCPNNGKNRGNLWSFPPKVRKQLQEDAESSTILHLFGGRSTFGTTLDIDPIVRPNVIGDAWMPPFQDDSFDTVILDPPYTHLNVDARIALLRQAARIARRRVVWFHTLWIPTTSGLKPERSWLIRVGDNCHVRCLQYFSVAHPKTIPPVTYFSRGPAMKYNRWIAQPSALPFG
jgi:hypothetical protein